MILYHGSNLEIDIIDLNKGYEENKTSSIPSFRYVLDDYVIEEK